MVRYHVRAANLCVGGGGWVSESESKREERERARGRERGREGGGANERDDVIAANQCAQCVCVPSERVVKRGVNARTRLHCE